MNKKLFDLIDNYHTPDNAKKLLQKAKILFIVGVSGAGKDTILKELLKTGRYHLIISHTTRKPRENHGVFEQDGKDYYFRDENDIEFMLNQNEFVEAKQYSGNIYGTSIAELQNAYNENKIAISDIEVQGVAEYKAAAPRTLAVFILPPDFETWQKRLKSRYQSKVDHADLDKRLATAKIELQEALSKNYFEYVVNDDLSQSVQIVDEIAHGNFSSEKNYQARQIAQKLLKAISLNL